MFEDLVTNIHLELNEINDNTHSRRPDIVCQSGAGVAKPSGVVEGVVRAS